MRLLYLLSFQGSLKKSEKGAQTKPIHVVQLSQVTDHKEQCAAAFCQWEERVTLLARHKNINNINSSHEEDVVETWGLCSFMV